METARPFRCGAFMTIEGGTAIVLAYLLVSIAVIVAFAGGRIHDLAECGWRLSALHSPMGS